MIHVPLGSMPSARATVERENQSAIDLPTVKTVRATFRYGDWLAPLPLGEDDFVVPDEDFPLIPLPIVRTIRATVRRAGSVEPMPIEEE